MNRTDKKRGSLPLMIVPHDATNPVMSGYAARKRAWWCAGILAAVIALGCSLVSYWEVHQQNTRLLAENERLQQRASALERQLFAERREREAIVEQFNSLLAEVDELNRKLAHTPSIYPAVGVVTSRYGYRRDPFHGAQRFHDGLDIANRYRSPIYATAAGEVVFVGRKPGHGCMVQIEHSPALATSYSHLARILVRTGEKVKKGQVIGEMGNTGRSTGVHVHYMVYERGRPTNPEKYLPD